MTIPQQKTLSGTVLLLPEDNVDTDRIVPARFVVSGSLRTAFHHVFADDRAAAKLRNSLHPFDDPRLAPATILVAGKNFGCGSSREHAAHALFGWGIRAIVAESLSDIFLNNCASIGLLCVAAKRIGEIYEALAGAAGGGATASLDIVVSATGACAIIGRTRFDLHINEIMRRRHLTGIWDPLQELLAATAHIDRVAGTLPYLSGWPD